MVAGLIRHVGFDCIAAIGQMIAARHRHRPGIAADNGVEAEQQRVGTVDDRNRRDLPVGNPGGGAVDREAGRRLRRVDNIVAGNRAGDRDRERRRTDGQAPGSLRSPRCRPRSGHVGFERIAAIGQRLRLRAT